MSICSVCCSSSSSSSGAQATATKLKESSVRFHELAAQTAPAQRVDSVAISPEAQQLLAQKPRSPS